MPLDLASQNALLPACVHSFAAHEPLEKAVYVFDFDGVLCSSFEDDLYHLTSWPGEEALLATAAAAFGVACQGMETKYQRHLLYQAAAWRLGTPTEPGPALPHAKTLGSSYPFFVLTARSGWYATERQRQFLTEHKLFPLEMFNVGRAGKEKQLAVLAKEYAGYTLFYVEDNAAHLAAAARMEISNLSLLHVEREKPCPPQNEMQKHVTDILTAALAKP